MDSSGRRNSISESDFLLHVPRGAELLEGARKILQRSSTSSGSGQFRLELIHDSFCEPLARMKEKREKQRRRRWFIIAAAVTLSSLAIGAYFIYLYSELRHSKEKIEQQYDEIDEKDEQIEEKNLMLSEKDSIMLGLGEKAAAFDAAAFILQTIWADESGRYDEMKDSMDKMPELKPFLITDVVEYLGNGVYRVDGVNYPTPSPSTDELTEWAKSIQQTGAKKIYRSNYDISDEMMRNEPGTVYLILRSKSISGHSEKQNWFALWNIMNGEQILKLYDILYRENYKLATINIKNQLRDLNMKAYDEAKQGHYEEALKAIDEAISIKPDEAYIYDSKDEILLMKGDERGAVKMWRKVISLDPDFIEKYEGGTELYKQLLERGLID